MVFNFIGWLLREIILPLLFYLPGSRQSLLPTSTAAEIWPSKSWGNRARKAWPGRRYMHSPQCPYFYDCLEHQCQAANFLGCHSESLKERRRKLDEEIRGHISGTLCGQPCLGNRAKIRPREGARLVPPRDSKWNGPCELSR